MIKGLFKKKYTKEFFYKLLAVNPFDEAEVSRVLKEDIDINFIDKNGASFLHFAIKMKLTTCALFLIEQGIDINIVNSHEDTAIHMAIDKANRLITQTLLEKDNIKTDMLKSNRTLLQDALIQGNINIIKILLNSKIDIHHTDNRGRNIIFDAVANGNIEIINLILEVEGLDLNILNNEKNTILHENIVLQDDDLALSLIAKGANPTILGASGQSYILHTSLKGIDTDEIIDTTYDSYFQNNINQSNTSQIFLEIMSAFSNFQKLPEKLRKNLIKTATKLLEKGIDISATDEKGETALFDIVRNNDIFAAKFLIEEDIPINTINNEGNNVLSEIVYKGIEVSEMIYLLLENKADLGVKNKKGQSIVQVFNDIILYTNGFIDQIDKDLEVLINPDGKYITLFTKMMLISPYNTSDIVVDGDPLFFNSFLLGDNELFNIYYKAGININALDKESNNIFIRYINQLSHLPEIPKDFRDNLITLVNRKVNINIQDKDGKMILSKLIAKNNIKLFKLLFTNATFNYAMVDKRGFNIIHDCISTSNIDVLRLIDQLEPSLKDMADNIGIIPITYAALFRKTELVRELIKLGSNFNSKKVISDTAKKKFAPLLANLSMIEGNDSNEQHIFNGLVEQTIKDFT